MTGSRAAVMGFMRIRGEYGQIKGVQAPVFALGELKYRGCVRGLIARVLWKWQCRINRKLPFFPKGEGSSSYSLRAASTNIFAENAHRSCALMLGITTYGRPNECGALILGLARSLRHAGMIEDSFLTVVRDTSEHDYAPVLQLLEQHFPGRFAFYEGAKWRGKSGRYLTYQIIFDHVRHLGARHAILMEDDVALNDEFVTRALSLYEAIDDPNKSALYLARFDDDDPKGQWVSFPRRACSEAPLDETAWLDLHAFVAGRRFFEVLDWTLFAPHPWRWVGNAKRSSGVSEQMTLRLFRRASIYQVRKSLAFHGRAPSILNVEARKDRALDNFPRLDSEAQANHSAAAERN